MARTPKIARLIVAGYLLVLINPHFSSAQFSSETLSTPSSPTRSSSSLQPSPTSSITKPQQNKSQSDPSSKKSITQKIKASLRRAATQARNQAQSLKNILWGAGSFGNHYIRRITGFAALATTAWAMTDQSANKDNKQPVIPKKEGVKPDEQDGEKKEQESTLAQQLSNAINSGNIEYAQAILNQGVNVTNIAPLADDNIINALRIAVQEKSILVISFLLGHVERYNINLNFFHTVEIGSQAIKSRNCEVIRALFSFETRHNSPQSTTKYVFFNNTNTAHFIDIISQSDNPDLLKILIDFKIPLSPAERKKLLDSAQTNRHFNLFNLVISICPYHEIPFMEAWEIAYRRNDHNLFRLLLEKRTNALQGNGLLQQDCPEEQKREGAIKEHLLYLFDHRKQEGIEEEISAWLRIMKANKTFLSKIIKNIFIDDRRYYQLYPELLDHELLPSDILQIAGNAVERRDYCIINILFNKQLAHPDRYMFFETRVNEPRLFKEISDTQGLLNIALADHNREGRNETLKKLICMLPYKTVASGKLWRVADLCEDEELILLLIDKRREAGAKDNFVNSILKKAIDKDIDAKKHEQKATYLKLLIERGAIPADDVVSDDGSYALLMTAVDNDLYDNVRILLECNDYSKGIPIGVWQRTVTKRNMQILELLLSHKSDTRQENISNTLLYAVRRQRAESVSILLSAGADRQITYTPFESNRTYTLLDLAIENHDPKTAEILINAGVKINLTPLAQEDDKEALKGEERETLIGLANLLLTHRNSIGLEGDQAQELTALIESPNIGVQARCNNGLADIDDGVRAEDKPANIALLLHKKQEEEENNPI